MYMNTFKQYIFSLIRNYSTLVNKITILGKVYLLLNYYSKNIQLSTIIKGIDITIYFRVIIF